MTPTSYSLSPQEDESPFARFAQAERERILAVCSRSLTLHQRILLHRRYIAEYRLNRIALMFGITVSAASQMHKRALRAFRAELRERNINRIGDLL